MNRSEDCRGRKKRRARRKAGRGGCRSTVGKNEGKRRKENAKGTGRSGKLEWKMLGKKKTVREEMER